MTAGRVVLTEGPAALSGGRIFSETRVQIAVRHPECIVRYFRPAEGDGASGRARATVVGYARTRKEGLVTKGEEQELAEATRRIVAR